MDRPNPEGTRAPPDRESESSSPANKRLRIVTRCGSLDEFFVTFGAFADESSLFIVTNKPRPLGLKQPFVIQLREGETIMRGDVEVIESITDGTGPDARNGMRLKLLQADDATRDVLRRLNEHAAARRAGPPGTAEAPRALTGSAPRPPGPDAAKPPAAEVPGTPAPATAAPPKAASHEERPAPNSRGQEIFVPGERAPGSAYQLPANPFEGVTAEALESFVECTLYEERDPRGSESDAANDAPPPSRSGSGLSSFPTSVVTAPATLAPPGSHALPPLPVLPPPPVFAVPPPPPTFGPAPQPAPPEPSPGRDAALIAAAIHAASPPQRRPWFVWFAGTAVVSSIASLAAAYFLWGRPAEGPSSGIAAQGTTSAPVPERTGSSLTPAVTATATATASAGVSAAPTAAPSIPALKRECKANIRSYPQGAAILWNGESLGTTPLADIPVPCGPSKVTFDLTGYEHGERSAGAVVGKTAGVFLRLVPTLVPVDVTSNPPGAQVLVDGHTVGRTPASITMVGMRESTIAVALPRYKPWSQKVTPQPPKATVHADLERK